MKKPDRDTGGDALEAFFEAARAAPPQVPKALMARVLEDAQEAQAPVRVPIWTRLGEVLGGWQGLSGLAAATCAGLWIGWSPPQALPDAGALIFGYGSTELLSNTAELTSFGWDLEEG
ncbi:hypothetical protein [uncultured Roseobacter sp.]|uniref:hypothetical protein n=1 Tax=uncultured Roseobacter sp. TaxID=114847 RepID=UPI00262A5FAE|nr:hypothetical protein [uncultured Roseobacter sp.]